MQKLSQWHVPCPNCQQDFTPATLTPDADGGLRCPNCSHYLDRDSFLMANSYGRWQVPQAQYSMDYDMDGLSQPADPGDHDDLAVLRDLLKPHPEAWCVIIDRSGDRCELMAGDDLPVCRGHLNRIIRILKTARLRLCQYSTVRGWCMGEVVGTWTRCKDHPETLKTAQPAWLTPMTAPRRTRTSPTTPADPRARKASARFSDLSIIRLLVSENPKKAGSNANVRFALYEDGITVEQFVERGGRRSDIHWDSERGFIVLEEATF